MFRVGVDIGGTFTDLTVVSDSGEVTLWKEPSTPDDPTQAIEVGLEAVAEVLGLGLGDFLGQTRLFVHGTTIATNQVIQRNGPEVGLLCTSGFRDVLYLRDGFKPERFNIRLEHPEEFVDRSLRIGVRERIGTDGEVLVELLEDDVREAAAAFRDAGVKAVAIAFIWSIVNPQHELRAAEILAEELPGVHVIRSSRVLPEIREWERTSATVLSAYIAPGIDEYLNRLKLTLAEAGLQRRPLIMQINGGCASVEEILDRPVNALGSGPAAAPAAALHHALALDVSDLITIDLGGTSFDVSLIRDGRPAMSRTVQVDMQPIGVPAVDVHSVAAGGGSIASVDTGGVLHVGPRSAGAVPGPACYGAGGDDATVTDATVVLGYLAPAAFLGGRRPLDPDLAADAIRRNVGEPLGLPVEQAAAGILRVVRENMVSAIRAVSIERGIDPRGFALVSGGGGGALHAAWLARELGMSQVLVPPAAGTLSSFGMTVTDVRHDHVAPFFATSSEVNLSRLDAVFTELENEAREAMARDGFESDQLTLERQVDARYQGQVYELTIPVPTAENHQTSDIDEIANRFHQEHRRQFAYSRPEMPLEFLHWRVVASGRVSMAQPDRKEPFSGELPVRGTRTAYVAETDQMTEVAVIAGEDLQPGTHGTGPAIVEMDTTTVLLGPGDHLRVLEDKTLAIGLADSEEKNAMARSGSHTDQGSR
jgi:N-methylhydantoinase A